MRLSKNGEVVELANEIHVAAYKAKGWVEVVEFEIMAEHEVEEAAEDGEPDEAEQVEEKPKRGRKAKTE